MTWARWQSFTYWLLPQHCRGHHLPCSLISSTSTSIFQLFKFHYHNTTRFPTTMDSTSLVRQSHHREPLEAKIGGHRGCSLKPRPSWPSNPFP
ncbi:hypothetical protein CCHR01_06210 [Colletotrichum chrysophilum]|uniref:Uncharacterized protein n=1 Tax=Colletotrichum chrysophilum TaxID=1836956 RepID=A0AAD9APH2_9PEZI|nr:hypothetical protein CCHR01_06210 [Colletotrichum chrysophilum]